MGLGCTTWLWGQSQSQGKSGQELLWAFGEKFIRSNLLSEPPISTAEQKFSKSYKFWLKGPIFAIFFLKNGQFHLEETNIYFPYMFRGVRGGRGAKQKLDKGNHSWVPHVELYDNP